MLIVGRGIRRLRPCGAAERRPGDLVGLIEAGGPAVDPDIAIPQQWPALQGRAYDWAYRTVPQAGTAGRVHDWPRGRLIGGSSCLHAMAHVRGDQDDFRAWVDATGLSRWSYEGLLPAFKRLERFSGGASAQHGADGPLTVMLPDAELSPVVRAYMQAAQSVGIPWLGDHNTGRLIGVAPNSLTIRAGRRVTAADAYLDPVRVRSNLTVIGNTRAHRLAASGNRVNGVIVERGGELATLAAGVTILAAGSIESPLLLMRSGVGAAEHLSRSGVRCLEDLDGVGENLHDHLLTAGNVYRAKKLVSPSRLQHSESLTYLCSEDFARTAVAPDIVLGCVAAPAVTECFERPATGSAFTILSGVTHPTSRGRIALSGPSVTDRPIIDPRYLSTEHDRSLAKRALEAARCVGRQPALAEWRAEELYPDAGCREDADISAFLQRAVMTHHHPVGTCRMGRDSQSVVDADLKLRCWDNVYVVDASVIPSITSGPIHAAVLAIAETFAAEVAKPLLA